MYFPGSSMAVSGGKIVNVINGYIYAKINRINATVNFRKKQESGDKLDDFFIGGSKNNLSVIYLQNAEGNSSGG